jgi:hypothetical protein
MIRNILLLFTVAAFFATMASALTGSYFTIRAVLNIAPGGPRRWTVRLWRLNAVLFPDELSETGQQYRARLLRSVMATLCSGGALVMFAVALSKAN